MENIQQPKIIKFQDIKNSILEELNRRIKNNELKFAFPEEVNLVDGFVNQLITNQISNSFELGGPTIPMIMLVGKKSGQIHFFALRALLPKIFE